LAAAAFRRAFALPKSSVVISADGTPPRSAADHTLNRIGDLPQLEGSLMRFQVNQGWLIGGQFLVPASEIIDLVDKQDHELSPCELLAKGLIPPLDSTALDVDAALVLWNKYPDHRHRLRRDLDPFSEQMFQDLLGAGA
jgi:hypothetical protein